MFFIFFQMTAAWFAHMVDFAWHKFPEDFFVDNEFREVSTREQKKFGSSFLVRNPTSMKSFILHFDDVKKHFL